MVQACPAQDARYSMPAATHNGWRVLMRSVLFLAITVTDAYKPDYEGNEGYCET